MTDTPFIPLARCNGYKKNRYFLKREKIANLLFDLAKYLLTVIVAGGMFLGDAFDRKTVSVGFCLAVIMVIVAVIATPSHEST